MLVRLATSLLIVMSVVSGIPASQSKVSSKLILKVDEKVEGPTGSRKFSSCLKVYSDGTVHFASWRKWGMAIVDEGGRKSTPEETISVAHHLEPFDAEELSSFFKSNAITIIPEKFAPPHQPIDYFELTSVQLMPPNGKSKRISTREFHVASLEEQARYPSALLVLMGKIDEIEKEASDKGKPTEVPADCHLNANDN